ncbi:hypothetical protein PAPYR_10351 [Paratrimastix pyriformis]|uniref:Uncharacterized protein n=1 Tax=Paratrimastix pyriformis TaxID=342808 RepID=A0ABQ8U664_9EUKA|nr:hypothetical protein PAPYR_10351 [Paratrimastix pyriformis]
MTCAALNRECVSLAKRYRLVQAQQRCLEAQLNRMAILGNVRTRAHLESERVLIAGLRREQHLLGQQHQLLRRLDDASALHRAWLLERQERASAHITRVRAVWRAQRALQRNLAADSNLLTIRFWSCVPRVSSQAAAWSRFTRSPAGRPGGP